MATYTVTTTKMNGSNTNTREFATFNQAYSCYCNKCDTFDLTNAEYSDMVEMNHTAGGVGYDWRVELTVNEDTI